VETGISPHLTSPEGEGLEKDILRVLKNQLL